MAPTTCGRWSRQQSAKRCTHGVAASTSTRIHAFSNEAAGPVVWCTAIDNAGTPSSSRALTPTWSSFTSFAAVELARLHASISRTSSATSHEQFHQDLRSSLARRCGTLGTSAHSGARPHKHHPWPCRVLSSTTACPTASSGAPFITDGDGGVVEHVAPRRPGALAFLLLAGPTVGARAVLASDPLPHVLRDCQGGAEEHAVREAMVVQRAIAMQQQPYTRRRAASSTEVFVRAAPDGRRATTDGQPGSRRRNWYRR